MSDINLTLNPPDENPDLLWISGEHSGDEHSSVITSELLNKNPKLHIYALGGKKLEKSGANLLLDFTKFSVVGFVEVIKNFSLFKNLLTETFNWIEKHRPKVVCFVDYPGFNLRLAKKLFDSKIASKSGGNVKLYYYISPQIWAWKSKRRFLMGDIIDELGTIFPFENECFKDTKLSTTFVGHPFVSEKFEQNIFYKQSSENILLLPGSRTKAINRIFPVLLKSFLIFKERYSQFKNFSAVAIYPNDHIKGVMSEIISRFKNCEVKLLNSSENIYASASLTSSGTISLKCALAEIPHAVVYKANLLTYLLGKIYVKIKFLGISNILLKKQAFPEFIQMKAKPDLLADEIFNCLTNSDRISKTKEYSAELRDILKKESINPSDWLEKCL